MHENNKWSHKGLKIDDVGLNGAFWAQKNYGVQISSKKMKSLCKWRVSVWNPDTSKEIVCFVHEVHPVFSVTLLLSRTCYVGEMMIPCKLGTFSDFISNAFQLHGLIVQNNQ